MRRTRFIVGLVVVALVAIGAVLLWPRAHEPCLATFEQVRKGMTYEDVCATVGAKRNIELVSAVRHERHTGGIWDADDARLLVWFDRDGSAVAVEIGPPVGRSSRWARLCAQLGL